MGTGWVPGIAPLPVHPVRTTPGTPPRHPWYTAVMVTVPHSHARGLNMVMGLRSVDQLSLDARFSGSQGMTEVYNLSIAGIINNHLLIPGNE